MSRPLTIHAHREPEKRALLVGSNYYHLGDSRLRLSNPCQDARKVRDLLVSKLGYAQDKIVLLVDDDHWHVDPRKVPRRANIKREMYALVNEVIGGDILFLYLAGHVEQVQCEEDSEEDGKDEAFIPMDCLPFCDGRRPGSDWLLDNELKRILVDRLPHGTRLVCIFDACHSGTLLDLPHDRCNSEPFLVTSGRPKRTYLTESSKGAAKSRTASLPVSLQRRVMCGSPCPRRRAVMPVGPVSQSRSREPEGCAHSASAGSGECSFVCICMPRKLSADSASAANGGTVLQGMFLDCASYEQAVLFGSPERMSRPSSPEVVVVKGTCDGKCEPMPDSLVKNVVSISACADPQLAWESTLGGSLTRVLVGFLEAASQPTYRMLMTHLSTELDNLTHKAHRKHRKKRRAGVVSASARCPGYQDPQLCSMMPLDLDQLFII